MIKEVARTMKMDKMTRWPDNGKDKRHAVHGVHLFRTGLRMARWCCWVSCSLLDRQVRRNKHFEEEGGFTERLYRLRTENGVINPPARL